ncbi:nitroreductase family protein [Alistipes sp. OttesenSCG-928-B03]|nr:nitroreductase family protein [Alistipes sp. OttesenSCG-928-B03]
MEFCELALRRRSVRRFDGRKPDRETIQKVLDATFTAPSSKSVRSTRIAVTDDPKILETIATMRSRGSSFVKYAPMVFFVMGDDSQTDLWRENCAISATILQFAAESLGLSSCWVHVNGRPHDDAEPEGKTAEEYLREQIPTLPRFRVMCVVAVGYPENQPVPHEPHDDSDKVFFL